MDAEMIIYLVIMSVVALIMIIIGVSQIANKDEPVGFHNVLETPKKEKFQMY